MKKILGIVAEYNPFHNGHLYHIEKSKQETQADCVVAIMTGNFTQRGDTSIVNKWEKTKMALNNGVDLVIELPTIYSISSAENFAYGAIKILNKLDIIDYLSFGIEEDDISNLEYIADILANEPKEFQEIFKNELSNGESFAKARSEAINKFINKNNPNNNNYTDILTGSNNILAIEYLKALKRMKSKIKPIGIKRNSVFYNSKRIIDNYASSTGIRHLIQIKKINEVSRLMPTSSFRILYENIRNNTYNLNLNVFSKEIIYKLRMMSNEEIADLPDVSEGLENLIKSSADKTNNIDELINMIKSKRYTQTRIQRILLYTLLGIRKNDMEVEKKITPYVRILGFNENGKEIISKINSKVKVVTSIKKFEDNNKNVKYKRMLDIDKRATNIYTLAYQKNSVANLDYTNGIIII